MMLRILGRPSSPRRALAALAVTSLLVLSGCATNHGRDSTTVSVPASPPHSTAGPALSSAGDPDQVEVRARRLDDVLDRAVAECMQARGFSQLQAVEKAPAPRAALHRPVLGVDPVELGPIFNAQARRYGIRGTYQLFVDPPQPVVESSAGDYQAALARCVDRVVPGAVEAYQMLAGWHTFMSELRTALLAEVDNSIQALLEARLRCVAGRGYPTLNVAEFLAGDTDAALDGLHIGPGFTTAASAEPSPLSPGTTRILPAPPQQSYIPNEPEVAFAQAYVACAGQVAFQTRLDAIVAPAAERLATSHRADLARYDTHFRQLLSALNGR
jgi:hypothetical protein